ncbi:MAG TPA: DUF1206 domain-containing protein [Gaiellales bacterium]|nr:DUF1206 domain-containing protein [Gaiellales bacterium]
MTTGDVLQQAAGQTERAAHGRWFRILARLGFVARGVVYALIGVFALDLAFGHSQANASQTGALQAVAHQPFGQWLLIVITVGLAAYASWRLMQALLGHGPEGGGENTAGYRIQAVVSAIIYASFTLLAIRILTSPNHQAGQKPKAHTAASQVLALPGGQIMLGIAGIVLIAVGLFQAYKGVSRKFVEEAKTNEMGPAMRTWYERIGVVGYCGRAAVFLLIGTLVLFAAVHDTAKQAKGLDGSLQTLANKPYGAAILCAIAAALVAFGLLSMLDARYRRV